MFANDMASTALTLVKYRLLSDSTTFAVVNKGTTADTTLAFV